MNTTAVNSDRPTTTATHERFFAAPLLDHDAYAAGFAMVRANRPLPQAEAATVYIDHEAVAAWLGSSRVSVGGRWIEVGR